MVGRIYATGLALALGLTVSTVAFADPWNGYYIGAFAGGAWSNGDTRTDVESDSPARYFTPTSAAAVEASASGDAHGQAFVGGVQVGANRRFDQFVIGAEIDYGAFNLGGRQSASDAEYPGFGNLLHYNVDASYSTDWLFTARGRLGWLTSPNLLIYFTGGLAVSDVKVSNSFVDRTAVLNPGAIGGSANSRTKAGYTLGGGFEFAVAGPWSVKGEYLYVDLGKSHVSSSIRYNNNYNPFDTSVDLTANIARIGVNYRLTD